MLLDFTNPVLDPRITFSRGTGATRVNASGFIEVVGNTTPRFDYDPVTLAPRGLLIEEARTNLLLRSQEFNDAAYTNSNVTVTANATAAPDGTTTADLLAAASTASVNLQQSSAVAATSATYSIFVKKGSGATQANAFRLRNTTTATTLVEITIDYDTGVLTYVTGSTGAVAVKFANGWWRVSLSATTGITSGDTIRCDQCFVGASTVGHSAYVWGAQLEAGAFATSYIPTVASTVSRSADVALMTGTNFSSWYNQTEGTFVAEASTPVAQAVAGRILEASAGTSSRVVDLSVVIGPNLQMYNGTTAFNAVGTVALNTPFKAAGAYRTANYGVVLNGGTATTNTDALVNTANALQIGRFNTASNYFNGHIRAIAYYNTRLPNTQLQTLTAPSLASPLALDFISPTYTVGY
jgi:hypothetical protein